MYADPARVLAVLVLEAWIGYPQWLFARVRHPGVWIGHFISTLERRC